MLDLRCHRALCVVVLATACTTPKSTPKTTAQVEAGDEVAETGDEVAETARPAPSCNVAALEFIFRVELHNPTVARDGLVGECIDRGWSRSERECVARAADVVALGECVTTSTRIMVANRASEGSIGIAACDRSIASYRRCIATALPVTIASDTQEALEITLAAWRERLSVDKEAGWRMVQRECGELVATLSRTLARYGCDGER